MGADAQPSDSQDSADASTQKELDYESDSLRAGISSPIDDKVILRPPRSVRRHGWLWTL